MAEDCWEEDWEEAVRVEVDCWAEAVKAEVGFQGEAGLRTRDTGDHTFLHRGRRFQICRAKSGGKTPFNGSIESKKRLTGWRRTVGRRR